MHYDIPDESTVQLIKSTLEKYHPELVEAGVTVEALMAFNDTGYPVKANGYPALACIRIVPLKSRIKGMADAEITIDKGAYDALNEPQREALLDHELNHLIVKRDKEQNIKVDDLDRPCLKMRKHDYQMGWFKVIAERHKENSPEVYQAKLLWRNDSKTFFPQV